MNTADYLLEKGRVGAEALVTERARYSYGQVREASARILAELLAAGIGPSDHIGLLASNTLFWVAGYLAALKLNAVVVPFPAVSTPQDVGAMARIAGCKAICVEGRLRGRYITAMPGEVLIIGDDVLSKPGPVTWPSDIPTTNEQQDAVLMFTSGTTARPRAVRVTHRNIQANTDAIVDYMHLTDADRMLVVLPFYYCFGTSLLHSHMRSGGTLIVSNTFTYPETVLDLMVKSECTSFAGVPSTFQTLLRNSTFPKRQFRTLRKVQQAGGKLPVVLIRELMEAAPEADIYIMYGQTEATARLSYLPPDLLEKKMGSVGRGIPGVFLRVVDETGAAVRPGEVGEVVAQGESICPGYYNELEATEQKFKDGVLHTGDLATVDEDGFIYITDRKSDFIKSYGHRVSSQQVEACVLELTDVVSAAAIGEPDMVRGEAIKVFITVNSGSLLIPGDVIAHCVKRLAHHMVPKEVVVVDQLPVNAHGKVVKAELRSSAELRS